MGRGPLLNEAPFTVQGARNGRINPKSDERPDDAHPNSVLPTGHVVRLGASSYADVIEPDATLTGVHPCTRESLSVLFEYDRTRRASKLCSKLARYDQFVADGWRSTVHARHPHEPTVLFVVREEQQINDALAEADRALTTWVGPSGGDPSAGRYPAREEIGFTTRRRLLHGDDRVDLVEPRPPTTTGGRTQGIVVRLPLPSLFVR